MLYSPVDCIMIWMAPLVGIIFTVFGDQAITIENHIWRKSWSDRSLRPVWPPHAGGAASSPFSCRATVCDHVLTLDWCQQDLKSMAECKAHSDWNKRKEAELASLAKSEILMSNTYTSQNLSCGFQMGVRLETEWEQWCGEIQGETCSTSVHAETRHWFQWNLLSSNEWNYFLILNFSNSTKASIYAVDGCRDHISLWVTRFGYLHEGSRWNLYTEFKCELQHVLCKA